MQALYAMVLVGAVALGQDNPTNRITVPLSDPSRPGNLKASLMNGCFTIEGYDGKDVLVEGTKGSAAQRHRSPRGSEGLRRIDPVGLGVTIEVENNNISIQGHNSDGDVTVRVPRNISMKVTCVNGGDLKVAGISGDLELNNHNANIVAVNVSGSVVAHSLNGKVTVSLDKMGADKPMSFSSLNGNVDLTIPADARATLRVKSDNGETYTDFDVQLTPSNTPVVEDNRAKGGKYRVRTDRAMIGTINGGGPDLTLKTMNGNIFLRKKK